MPKITKKVQYPCSHLAIASKEDKFITPESYCLECEESRALKTIKKEEKEEIKKLDVPNYGQYVPQGGLIMEGKEADIINIVKKINEIIDYLK